MAGLTLKNQANMKKVILFICCLFLLVFTFAQVNPSNTYVKGYYRSNGTYVKGHYRTEANYTNRDNYTTYPNVNPYTGKKGYIKPDNKGLPVNNFNNSIPTIKYDVPASPSQERLNQIIIDDKFKKWDNNVQEQVKKTNDMLEYKGKEPNQVLMSSDEFMKKWEQEKAQELKEYNEYVKDIPNIVRPTFLQYQTEKSKKALDDMIKNNSSFK